MLLWILLVAKKKWFVKLILLQDINDLVSHTSEEYVIDYLIFSKSSNIYWSPLVCQAYDGLRETQKQIRTGTWFARDPESHTDTSVCGEPLTCTWYLIICEAEILRIRRKKWGSQSRASTLDLGLLTSSPVTFPFYHCFLSICDFKKRTLTDGGTVPLE